jgi:hypothetical protein
MGEYVGSLDKKIETKLRNMVKLSYLDGEADGVRSYAAIAWAVKGKD